MSLFGKPSGGEPRITYERIDLAAEPFGEQAEPLPLGGMRSPVERLEPRIERAKGGPDARAEAAVMLVAADSEMEGVLRSRGVVRVEGVLRGTLHAPLLLLEPGGLVEGTVHVERARICGTLRGSVTAREVEVVRTAALDAELVYDEISIERGARVRGLHRQRDPEPPAARAVTPQPEATPDMPDPALLAAAAASTAALVAEAEAALQELAQATQAAAGAVTDLAQDGIQELVELEAELRDTPEAILRDTLAA
ncbi:polymer-forming cytoskeletal protein [Roseomonas sp. M0104]|uniref:Polymer-forming cytoskeletal protein n=1 Tax=Teichococcus coralli TaxID=2545983 RepID=A0A845BEM4_9PROT|nr:polymer-forming cytoskeletal protein [Pseudoroseomonas coralli]MXP65571.1 polymer-forming cytoskeletal protein [Pseudoroseomonas coralli]